MFGNPIRIADGVFQLRAIGARVTVIAEAGDAILVDSGLPGSFRAINRGLLACGLSVDRISHIVATHAHPDHIGGLAELVAGTGIKVAVHEMEADVVEGSIPAPTPFRSRVPRRRIPSCGLMADRRPGSCNFAPQGRGLYAFPR